MSFVQDYETHEPSRREVDDFSGATVLEFGNVWCGFCRRAEPLIEQAFASHTGVRHIRIADASGRRLGRSFQVKFWPTLVFLKDGKEISRLVRPNDLTAIKRALEQVDPD